ncbi:hypothetical protein CEXT_267321 [Caerostris extrusa]|uniref:Uncharacterized protein n=1 Tax=Caerostris extrusa TaxID=172846 RepID=A0AAV4QYU8_CAEEX|nr:hypothetical protein CEXT_267321 [Caerostris extrusa]
MSFLERLARQTHFEETRHLFLKLSPRLLYIMDYEEKIKTYFEAETLLSNFSSDMFFPFFLKESLPKKSFRVGSSTDGFSHLLTKKNDLVFYHIPKTCKCFISTRMNFYEYGEYVLRYKCYRQQTNGATRKALAKIHDRKAILGDSRKYFGMSFSREISEANTFRGDTSPVLKLSPRLSYIMDYEEN